MRQPQKHRGASVVTVVVVVLVIVMVSCASGQQVKFFEDQFYVEEGDQFEARLDLSGTITEPVRVIVEVVGDTGDDFIGDTQVATFTPSSRHAWATFTVRDDDKPEDEERFTLKIIFISQGLYLGSPQTATVFVAASDDGFGIFGFAEDSPVLVTEEQYTSVVNLNVVRRVSYFETIKVTFEVESLSEQGLLADDISPVTGSIVFRPGSAHPDTMIQLKIQPDAIPENDESFLVTLTDVDRGASINVSQVIVIIKANDAPIRFSQARYVFDEGPGSRSWSVEVYRGIDGSGNRIGPVNREVTVEYRSMDNEAVSGQDYSFSGRELLFGPGETVKTITFVIEDDVLPEMRESFKIRLLGKNGDAVFVNPSEAEVVINANDDSNGKIMFKPVTENSDETPVVTVNEDTFTIASFTVLRKLGTFGEVSVGWELERVGSNPESVSEDVGPTSGRVVFAEGDSRKEIELTIVQDSLPEPAEQFRLTLLAGSVTGNATLDGIITAILVIEDSDNVYGAVEFGPDTTHRVDISASPRTLRLAVTRNGGRQDTALVNINVSYVDDDIEALPENIFEEWMKTATLPSGSDPVVVSFNLLPTAFLTIGGQFHATMDSPRLATAPQYGSYNSPTLGVRRQVTVAVSEAEANGESGFNNTAAIVVEEPDSGTLEVPLLIIREGMSGTAVISWTIKGVGPSEDSVDEKDVAALNGTITIYSGFSSVDLVVIIKADDVPEIDETLKVQLTRIEPYSNQRLRPGSREIEITVLKNDNPGGVFQFSGDMNDSYVVQEGKDPIEVIVERVGGILERRVVQVEVIPDGTSEFYGTPSALVFEPGMRVSTLTILARNEGEPELAEYFTLRLTPLGNSTLGERTSISITVSESDYPYGIIQFKEDPTMIIISETAEGNPVNVSLEIERDRGTFFEVSVPWKLSPETGDLRPSSGTIMFARGQNSYTLVLQTVDDDEPEGVETFAVQLGQPVGGAVAGRPMVATVTIRENDNPVVFTENLVYMEEPGTHTFTVRRSGNLQSAVTVAYRTLDGSASKLEGDYGEIFRETLSFDRGVSDRTLSVTVRDDIVPEGNETFTLELFDATGDLLITENSRTTVVILANDDAYGVFSLETPDNNKVEEGSTIYYHIIRNQGIFGEVEVTWEIRTLQNAVPEASEFQATSGSVVFQSQESRTALGIVPLADQTPEGQEVFRITLTSVSVVTGISGRGLARLADSGLQMDIVVLASDDPSGRFAFPTASQELSVAEDYDPGSEDSISTSFTVERRQGTQGTVQVLWEIFSEPFGTNLPAVYDLLFIGQRPASVSSEPSKRREGTGTSVFRFSGAEDSYVTIPSSLEPAEDDFSAGFSISAWVQPYPQCDGYIVARGSADGTDLYFGLRLVTTASSTTFDMTLSSESSVANNFSAVVTSTVIQDGHWHHVLVAVGNVTVQFYLDGTLISSSALSSGVPKTGAGVLLVGARPPSDEQFEGYMQDVRIWARTFDSSEAEALYRTPPLNDVTPVSGVLLYNTGVRTQTFSVSSLQDIEEEGDEVFSVSLVATTGGAALSVADSRTTLTVLKSDNANGLFGFREACTPSRIDDESAKLVCNVQRQRGDDGTVNVTWLIRQRTAAGLNGADSDFDAVTGLLVFLRGERLKTFEVQVTDETVPELDELFEVSLVSAVSADGVIGSTNTSGASVDPTKQRHQVTIAANDYPFGLFQFGQKVGVPPHP
ncbi:adhesion G-protein coupled receptor V1-like [Babylonia areolata]|uniref:adhesion G-protein coupled receptor V1-like n=1 Tax=Babylonia areolata TaxID=304850 RepID=UPI003FD51B3B